MNIKTLIEKDFFDYIIKNQIQIYNEISFQLELGLFLRNEFPAYRVEFERNIKKEPLFPNDPTKTIKHEIDIVIWKDLQNGKKEYKCAIELKFPKNGQYPEEMYQFIKDIRFMEEAKRLGFEQAYSVVLVNDMTFYNPKLIQTGIYAYYRAAAPIKGSIYKPTGSKTDHIDIDGSYTAVWKPIKDQKGEDYKIDGSPTRMYIIEV